MGAGSVSSTLYNEDINLSVDGRVGSKVGVDMTNTVLERPSAEKGSVGVTGRYVSKATSNLGLAFLSMRSAILVVRTVRLKTTVRAAVRTLLVLMPVGSKIIVWTVVRTWI